MRTTIDLPEDVHRILTAVARDRGQTLSQTVTGMLRTTLMPGDAPRVYIDPTIGLPVVHFGHVVTSEDVKSLEDEW
jgi:hypothetical protein